MLGSARVDDIMLWSEMEMLMSGGNVAIPESAQSLAGSLTDGVVESTTMLKDAETFAWSTSDGVVETKTKKNAKGKGLVWSTSDGIVESTE